MSGPRMLVTGAPGWIGTSLVEAIVKGFSAGPAAQSPESVRVVAKPETDTGALASMKAIEIVPADLRDATALDGVCNGVDTVFHCAGLIHPDRIGDLYAVNVEGTRNLLAAAVQAKARRFVYLSSNSPAGLSRDHAHLMVESEPPRPYLNYGKSKLQAEDLVREAHQQGRIETVVLRPCWFYGPNQPLRQTTFFKMIKGGRPIMVGPGDNLRSMSYVDNIVQGALLARDVPSAGGQTYFIADRRPYSFREILETVAKLLGVEIEPRRLPLFAGKCAQALDACMQAVGLYKQEVHVAGELGESIAVSIEKAEKELGYAPEIELEEGMRRSIAWCRARGIDI